MKILPLYIMGSLAAMAIISILGAIVTGVITSQQQDDEFFQQEKLLGEQQEFSAEQADLAYERNKRSTDYQDMLDAGFNPNLAALSAMGQANNPAAAASSSGAPTTNSAIGALSSMFGQGGQNLYDLWKNQAEIENIQANTDKTEVETGILPRDYMLRNLSVTKQLDLWDAQVKRTAAAQHLDEEQTKLVSNQNMYYGRMAEAQIKSYQAQVAQAYADASLKLEQINTEQSKQRELDTQAGLNVANTQLAHSEDILVSNQASTEYYKSESARIAQEFEKKLGDVPLTVDGQKYVQSLVVKGDIDGIQTFYNNIFTTALNQAVGEAYGTPARAGAPFGILSGLPLFGVQKDQFNNVGNFQPPLWNPIGR